MRGQSEALLALVLLPIFCVGALPILAMYFLGFVGLGLLGILFMCVGLSDGLRANSDFNREIIVAGYSPPSELAFHASRLRSTARFAVAMNLAGVSLIAAALLGLVFAA